jgi:hypothetical protein
MEGQQLLGARPTQQPMREQRLIEREPGVWTNGPEPYASMNASSVFGD